MLSDLFDPVSQLLERLEAIDGEDQEDRRDALVEGPDHSLEQFLPCLFSVKITVSQICNLTCFSSSICKIFEVYSTPTVTLYDYIKVPLMYRVIRLVFPTAEVVAKYIEVPARLF